jgi:hypothetical protein
MNEVDFNKLGLEWDGTQWCNDDYVMHVTIDYISTVTPNSITYTYCKRSDINKTKHGDIVDSDNIIVQGGLEVIMAYITQLDRSGKLKDLGI